MGLGRPRGVGVSLLHCGYCLMDHFPACMIMIQGGNGNITRRGERMNQALFTFVLAWGSPYAMVK